MTGRTADCCGGGAALTAAGGGWDVARTAGTGGTGVPRTAGWAGCGGCGVARTAGAGDWAVVLDAGWGCGGTGAPGIAGGPPCPAGIRGVPCGGVGTFLNVLRGAGVVGIDGWFPVIVRGGTTPPPLVAMIASRARVGGSIGCESWTRNDDGLIW
ncbi:MAG: hypothetical protein FJ087_23805 [Deltaproteobacteria bacterium]|nr:hypothetical protein [Deltaproteobacteria bacterium]